MKNSGGGGGRIDFENSFGGQFLKLDHRFDLDSMLLLLLHYEEDQRSLLSRKNHRQKKQPQNWYHHQHTGQLEYKIKWKGYPHEQCTWEPFYHLAAVPRLVNKFNKSFTAAHPINK